MKFLSKYLIVLVAAASLAIGCGGEGGEESTGAGFNVYASTTVTTGPLDKPRFVAHVNKLCREGWAEILDNFTEYSSWQKAKKMSRQEVFIDSVRESFLAGFDFHVFDEIYLLGGPSGEEKDVEDVIGALQLAVERGQRQVQVSSPSQLTALFADYNRRARAYGLEDCLVDGVRVQRAQA
ncbi:MAG: hypothetical protein ABW196_02925 [Solirubrobacterales bacterium]